MLQHVVDYPASSGIAEEGVLVVYYEAVKTGGLVLIEQSTESSNRKNFLGSHPSVFSFTLMHVK